MGEVLIRHGDGETISERDQRNVVLLAHREDITITWSRYAAGERGPDPHIHRQHTDAFYVLDGELTFELGPDAERTRAPAGTFVAAPPNLVHSFANEGSTDVRYLNLHTPDKGFAGFMRAARDGAGASWDSFDPPADGGLPLAEAIVSGPGEGERLVSGNRVALLKAVLPDLSFAEWELDGPFEGPHVHKHDDGIDSFYVLEGELAMTVEGSVHPAGPGTLASVPRGVLHTFNHTKAGKARVLNVHAPDNEFADFLRRVSD